MSSTFFQIASVTAGLALLATGFIIFPGGRMTSLAKSQAVTLSLAVVAACLIAAVRNFGP
jgi:hypothetical protein